MPLSTITFHGSDAAQDVRDKFGDIGSVQITDAMLLRWINNGQREIASDAPSSEATATGSLVQGTSVYDLGVIGTRVRSVSQIIVNGVLAKILPWPEYVSLISEYQASAQSGAPVSAAIYGGSLNLWPIPNVSVANGITLYYTQYPLELTVLTGLLSIPDRFFAALCDYVFAQALELDENFEASAAKLSNFNTRLAGQRARLGENPSDYYPTITMLPEDDGYYPGDGSPNAW